MSSQAPQTLFNGAEMFEEGLDLELFGLLPSNRGDEQEECQFLKSLDYYQAKKREEDNTLTTSAKDTCQKTSNVEDLDFPDLLQEVLYDSHIEDHGQMIVLQDVPDPESLMEVECLEAPKPVPKENNRDMSKPAVIPASALLALQDQTPYDYEKATNMAKFIIRLFIKRYADYLPEDRQRQLHIRFVERYFEKNERKNKTAADMVFLFGLNPNERNNRWAGIRRVIMHRILAESSKRKLVLENNYIKDTLKIHYQYSLKIYEWRLNQPQLVGNFN